MKKRSPSSPIRLCVCVSALASYGSQRALHFAQRTTLSPKRQHHPGQRQAHLQGLYLGSEPQGGATSILNAFHVISFPLALRRQVTCKRN